MARIQVRPAGDTLPQSGGGNVGAPASAFDNGASGLVRIGQQGQQIAEQMAQDQLARENQVAEVARKVAAVNAHGAISVALSQDLPDKYRVGILDGTISPQDAQAQFRTDAQKVIADTLDGLHPQDAAMIRAQAVQTLGAGANRVGDVVREYNQRTVLTGLITAEEQYQRLAMTDRAKATKEYLQTLDVLGPQAGYTPDVIQKKAQAFKENVAFSLGFEMTNAAKNAKSIAALNDAEKRLNGDEFADIDPQRKMVLVNHIDAARNTLLHKAQIDADRREAKAERAVALVERQLSAGVPLNPEGWLALQYATKGTGMEGYARGLIQSEREIQDVLRQPIEKQLAFLQERQAQLAQGGTLEQAANLNRLSNAVQQNVRTLQTDPLAFAAQRGGVDVPPLDMAKVVTAPNELRDQITQRWATVNGMRRQYGKVVPEKILLPAEAKQISAMLNDGSPAQQAQFLGVLRDLAGGDSQVYQSMIRQVAPDSPVRALAGILADRQANVTVQKNLISSDLVRSAGDISSTILRGESIINPTKADKASDGKPQANLYKPDAQPFNSEFVKYVGAAFADRPQALQAAQQAALAYYVGRAAETGRLNKDPKDIDTALVREALVATLGEPYERGGTSSFAPWGMSAAEFERAATGEFKRQIAARGLPQSMIDRWPQLGLKQMTGDTYVVVNGRNVITDDQNRPLTIRVQGPGDSMRDASGTKVRDLVIPK